MTDGHDAEQEQQREPPAHRHGDTPERGEPGRQRGTSHTAPSAGDRHGADRAGQHRTDRDALELRLRPQREPVAQSVAAPGP